MAAAAMQLVLGLAAAFYALSVGNAWLMAAVMFVNGFGGGPGRRGAALSAGGLGIWYAMRASGRRRVQLRPAPSP